MKLSDQIIREAEQTMAAERVERAREVAEQLLGKEPVAGSSEAQKLLWQVAIVGFTERIAAYGAAAEARGRQQAEQNFPTLVEVERLLKRAQQAEQARDDLPHLTWESPDADGDHIVWLKGVPHWHLVHHGDTPLVALVGLAEGIVVAANMDKPSRVELKEQVAALTQALKDATSRCSACSGTGALRIIVGVENHNAKYEDRPCVICSPWRAALTGAQACSEQTRAALSLLCPKCGGTCGEPHYKNTWGEIDWLIYTCSTCGYEERKTPLDRLKAIAAQKPAPPAEEKA